MVGDNKKGKHIPRNDEESNLAVHNPKLQPLHRKKSNKCMVYLLAWFVALCAILLVFSLIMLRPTPPLINLSSAAVKSLSYSANTPSFNLTLLYGITIKNDNFVEFKYKNSTGNVMYGAVVVGVVKLGDGSVKGKGTLKKDVIVDARSNGQIFNINNGTLLNMTSYTNLVGRFRLLRVFKITKTSAMSCSISLNLTTSSIQHLICN